MKVQKKILVTSVLALTMSPSVWAQELVTSFPPPLPEVGKAQPADNASLPEAAPLPRTPGSGLAPMAAAAPAADRLPANSPAPTPTDLAPASEKTPGKDGTAVVYTPDTTLRARYLSSTEMSAAFGSDFVSKPNVTIKPDGSLSLTLNVLKKCEKAFTVTAQVDDRPNPQGLQKAGFKIWFDPGTRVDGASAGSYCLDKDKIPGIDQNPKSTEYGLTQVTLYSKEKIKDPEKGANYQLGIFFSPEKAAPTDSSHFVGLNGEDGKPLEFKTANKQREEARTKKLAIQKATVNKAETAFKGCIEAARDSVTLNDLQSAMDNALENLSVVAANGGQVDEQREREVYEAGLDGLVKMVQAVRESAKSASSEELSKIEADIKRINKRMKQLKASPEQLRETAYAMGEVAVRHQLLADNPKTLKKSMASAKRVLKDSFALLAPKDTVGRDALKETEAEMIAGEGDTYASLGNWGEYQKWEKKMAEAAQKHQQSACKITKEGPSEDCMSAQLELQKFMPQMTQVGMMSPSSARAIQLYQRTVQAQQGGMMNGGANLANIANAAINPGAFGGAPGAGLGAAATPGIGMGGFNNGIPGLALGPNGPVTAGAGAGAPAGFDPRAVMSGNGASFGGPIGSQMGGALIGGAPLR